MITVGDAVVYVGDCRERLKLLLDNSVDSVVTDPPYELGFMGKKWDSSGVAYDVTVWQECLRVLKPGGHILAFGGSRTWHRLAVAVEDAGFELRDSIAWLYGSGFPKSLDVSKAIDKRAGAEREVIGTWKPTGKARLVGGKNADGIFQDYATAGTLKDSVDITAPATSEAKAWEGWGTALKPAFEPVVVGRKPLVGTVAENVLEWGVGGLNIDGSRISSNEITGRPQYESKGWKNTSGMTGSTNEDWKKGRWPANVILDEVTAGLLDEQSGENPSRFFYQAKASKRDRNEGLEDPNAHPTVKPTQLMRYLIKLVTPPGGTVLDPFTGSGSTGKAALLDGYKFVGVELTEEYLPIIEGRLKWASEQKDKTGDETLF